MTREAAHARAAHLNGEGSDTTGWVARRAEGTWEVVRLTVPGLARVEATGARTESRPRPEDPPDDRPLIIRNIPPYGPG